MTRNPAKTASHNPFVHDTFQAVCLKSGEKHYLMQTDTIAALRAQVAALERGSGAGLAASRLPFGLPELDAHLPGRGLALGAVHELFAGGPAVEHGAAPALFAASVLGRRPGPVLWIAARGDLYPPALARAVPGVHEHQAGGIKAGSASSPRDGYSSRRRPRTCSASCCAGRHGSTTRRSGHPRPLPPAGGSPACPRRPPCRMPRTCPASAGRCGDWSCCGAGARKRPALLWRVRMHRVVSLFLPTWPTDRLRRHGHAAWPVGQPLVTRAHDGRRSVIAAACTAARTQGLRPTMPLAQAMATVPDLLVTDADPEGDGRALADLAAWCLRWSPLTAPDPPDGVWIDATGCAHLHGGEQAMLDALVGRLAGAGLSVRAGLADTPGTAHALARHGAAPVTVAALGAQAGALALLPMRALRIPDEMAGSLRRLGLDLVGQLFAAPRAPLARRFGDALLLRLDQALGRVAEPIRPVLPPGTISIRRAFVEPIATAEAFAAVILVLVGDACAALQARGEGARTLDLVFERVDGSTQAVRVGTARPVRDPMHLARLLDERIETVDPGFGVEAMRLTLPLVGPLAPVQRTSGLDGSLGEAADIAALIDGLSNRLGAGRVYRVAPVDSDVPERAVAAVPPLALSGEQGWTTPWPRPARLLPRPEPVDAMGLLPDHSPRWFIWRQVRHCVVRADGPERITGEWWRRSSERATIRDYWVVEDEDGCRFWLFRRGDGLDPATGGLAWFLHGFF